jgi:predicted aspartyl protease
MQRQHATLIALIAVLSDCAWLFAQNPPKPVTESDSKKVVVKATGDLDSFLTERGCVPIPLERSAGYVPIIVSIGQKRLRLMCDTGSPLSYLDEKRTKELEIDWNTTGPIKSEGDTRGTRVCKIDVVDVGVFRAHGVRFHNYDMTSLNDNLKAYREQPLDGVLGGNELREYSAVIDCRSMQVYLRSPNQAVRGKSDAKLAPSRDLAGELERFLTNRSHSAAPLERTHGGNYVVVASVGDKKLRLVCDTGAPESTLDEKRSENLKLDWDKSEYNVVAGDFAKSCKVEVMGLNGFEAHGIRFHSYDMTNGNKQMELYKDAPVDGLLGWDVLRDYSAIIEIRAARLYLRTRKY